MGILEITCFLAKPGIKADDDSTAEGKLVREAWEVAASQPGAGAIYWAHEVENPSKFWVFMEWDSNEAYLDWTNHPKHAAIISKIGPMFEPDRGGFVKRAMVDPLPVRVLDTDNAGVVEVLASYCPADISSEKKDKIASIFAGLRDTSLGTIPDIKGASMGWGIDNDFPLPPDDKDVGSAGDHAVFWAFVGWSSIEAHLKFCESAEFKDGLAATDLSSIIKYVAVHVSCQKLVKK